MSSRERRALDALIAAVAPLVDRELDGPDGEELHAALVEAYDAAVKAAKPRPFGEIPCVVNVGPPSPPEVRLVPVPVTWERWLRA